MKGSRLTNEQLGSIIAGTDRGQSAAAIAAGLGVSTRTVERHQLGLKLREKANRTTPTGWRDHAERLLDDGASVTEAARTVGVAPRTVCAAFPGRAWTNAQALEHARICHYSKGLTS